MIKKSLFLFLVIFLFFSCKENIYKNSKYGYKLEFPENWIPMNSNINKKGQIEFKDRIDREKGLAIYQNVDVAFYNPNSNGPVYDIISVSTIPKVINIDNVLKNKKEIDYTLEYQLRSTFTDVVIANYDFLQYKKGKGYRVDFFCKYKNIGCYASIIILTKNLFYSNMITTISREERRVGVLELRDKLINSFKN